MPRAANPTQDWPPGFLARAALGAYRAAAWLVAPVVAGWFVCSPGKRVMLRRFRPPRPPSLAGRPVWVHACSVGEVNTARPLLEALRRRWAGLPLLLTTSTPTGYALAQQNTTAPATWFPLDHPRTVRRFFRQVRPQALMLVETELWPNVLAEAHRTGVPVALVNGRISDAHARGYRRLAAFWRPLLRPVAAAAVQNEPSAERLTGLGLPRERLSVAGNIKFDAVDAAIDPADRAALRRELGLPADAPVLVFGSTRPGDEALAAACWSQLAARFPELYLIVAPRHLDRLDAALAPFERWDVERRSEQKRSSAVSQDARVLLLDTHGELSRIYSIAAIAVIGGSFYPGVEGHNPIEPAAQGVPAVFGPHMRNFQDVADALLGNGGAFQVTGPGALCEQLGRLFSDAQERAQIGAQGRETVLAHQGAIERTLEALAPLIDACRP